MAAEPHATAGFAAAAVTMGPVGPMRLAHLFDGAVRYGLSIQRDRL